MRIWRGLPGVLAAGAALLLAGCVTTPVPPFAVPPEVGRTERTELNRAVFGRVWQLVADLHYDPRLGGVDWRSAAQTYGPQAVAAADDRALYRVLNAMLEPLGDSHTQALTPRQAEDRRTRTMARTGFNLLRLEGQWVVSEVLPGTPAERAGIRAGWIVRARGGRPLGERVDFRARDGEAGEWEFLDAADRTVRAAPVAQLLPTGPRQVARELEGGWVYLRFDEFDGPDRRWLAERLAEHARAPGIVLDLRRNGGGETFSLGIALGEFFDRRVDCGTFVTRSGRRSVKNSWQVGSARFAGQVAVLVDAATGSAAEIFTAVMQDQDRAVVVGRRTAGAVLASTFHRLPDGGRLQLSREDYVAPKGRRLEGAGVAPDVAVPLTLADLRAGRDPDLEAALQVLREGRPPRATAARTP
jgi:carboxyl-terminal processing protease